MPKVTKHGENRMRKRVGIPKKNVNKWVNDAYDHGLRHAECKGRLRKYFEYLARDPTFGYNPATSIRMYANYVWIFSNSKLVTVFPIPKAHRDAVIKQLKKKGYKACTLSTTTTTMEDVQPQ